MRDKSLKKNLNCLDIFTICSGTMISSGLFILPGLIYSRVGPGVILVYLVAGIFVLPALFSKVELITAMPKAGGDYFFIERSLGCIAGTLSGFASWFSLSFKSAFALFGIGEVAVLMYPDISEFEVKLIAVGFCILFTIINLVSVKHTGKTQTFFVMLLIALLLLYIGGGFFQIDYKRYTPFITGSKNAFFLSVGMVFISFAGLTKVASVAEEIKKPEKSVPPDMISAYVCVLIIYVLIVFITVGVLDGHKLSKTLVPLSLGGVNIFGRGGLVIMAVAAILGFVSTANAGILAASRFPVAMSRDLLLPSAFGEINKKYDTPHFSILFTSISMIAIIYFLDLESLVKVASAMQLILFILIFLSVIAMRESKIHDYRPSFRSPLYPWLQIGGILSYSFFLFEMGVPSLFTFLGFVILSLLWFTFYVKGASIRKPALIHIVERIISKKLARDSLVEELREIIKERDHEIEVQIKKITSEVGAKNIYNKNDRQEVASFVSTPGEGPSLQ